MAAAKPENPNKLIKMAVAKPENPKNQNKMAAAKPEGKSKEDKIPARLFDTTTRKTYKRMRFFGSGGFAKCYEIIDVATDEVFAGKILSKKLMINHNIRKELTDKEINIHRSLSHPNVVMFHTSFEDIQNIYMVLDLCKKRSMQDLQNRRRTITDFECRYYMYQLIQGVKYLHDKRLIHRDLKLANIFLDALLHVKIGDFGLAMRIDYEDELNNMLVGTPGYMAPEVLAEKGHSRESDIWAIGCIMYTLLVGQPPFIQKLWKDTCTKILKCQYRVPSYVNKSATDMINAMLQVNQKSRPAIGQLLNFEFIKAKNAVQRNPLMMMNCNCLKTTFLKAQEYRNDIKSLYQQLTNLINGNPRIWPRNLDDENSDPAAHPRYWISKYYSDKYGFGYQLCNDGIGVMFNDDTKLIQSPKRPTMCFIDKDEQKTYMTNTDCCKALGNKMKLVSYFKRHMSKKLKAGANNVIIESDPSLRMPHLHAHFCTECALVMHLTNGTVQLNFTDHLKIILCPRNSAITYMDRQKNFRTYRFSTIVEKGVSKGLFQRMCHAQETLKLMLDNYK